MKITVTATVPYDNPIWFHDTLKGIAAICHELADEALRTGDTDGLDTVRVIRSENDDAEDVGTLTISEN